MPSPTITRITRGLENGLAMDMYTSLSEGLLSKVIRERRPHEPQTANFLQSSDVDEDDVDETGGMTWRNMSRSFTSQQSVAPRDSDVSSLMMVMGVKDASTMTGYVVKSDAAHSRTCRAIEVKVYTKEKTLTLAAGTAQVEALRSLRTAVSTKQTPRMRWLDAVWLKTFEGLSLSESDTTIDVPNSFVAQRQIAGESLTPQQKRNLLMMMFWNHWEKDEYSDEAKMAELREYRLSMSESRGAFYNMLHRLEFRYAEFV